MTTQVQLGKAQPEHAQFTGALAEITVDTSKNTNIHDGQDVGGFELQRARWEVANETEVYHADLDG